MKPQRTANIAKSNEDAPVVNPNNFEVEMTKEQRQNFYLKTDNAGRIILKPCHPYHYQIQMSLHICELQMLVRSGSEYIVVIVEYDSSFWHEKRLRLKNRHIQMVLPEVVIGRTKRWLEPIELHSNQDSRPQESKRP